MDGLIAEIFVPSPPSSVAGGDTCLEGVLCSGPTVPVSVEQELDVVVLVKAVTAGTDEADEDVVAALVVRAAAAAILRV